MKYSLLVLSPVISSHLSLQQHVQVLKTGQHWNYETLYTFCLETSKRSRVLKLFITSFLLKVSISVFSSPCYFVRFLQVQSKTDRA